MSRDIEALLERINGYLEPDERIDVLHSVSEYALSDKEERYEIISCRGDNFERKKKVDSYRSELSAIEALEAIAAFLER